MNKLVKVAMVASALFIPHIANAALPSGPFWGDSWIINVGGISITCTGGVLINSSSTQLVITIDSVSGLCPEAAFNNQPYDVSFTEDPGGLGGTFVIHGLDFDMLSWGCLGDAYGEWYYGWGAVNLYLDAILPSKIPGMGNCTITGELGSQ